jgi:HlyD family secretion protein
LRTIETGVANWEYTQVVSGLSEGELLVSSVDREGVADGALAQPE